MNTAAALKLLLLATSSVTQFAIAAQEISRVIKQARTEDRDVTPEELAAIAKQTDQLSARVKSNLKSVANG